MRLIDATEAAAWASEHILDAKERYAILDFLRESATVDEIVPVRCGRWIATAYTSISQRNRRISCVKYACSECGYGNGRKKTRYCPQCGTEMALEVNDAEDHD